MSMGRIDTNNNHGNPLTLTSKSDLDFYTSSMKSKTDFNDSVSDSNTSEKAFQSGGESDSSSTLHFTRRGHLPLSSLDGQKLRSTLQDRKSIRQTRANLQQMLTTPTSKRAKDFLNYCDENFGTNPTDVFSIQFWLAVEKWKLLFRNPMNEEEIHKNAVNLKEEYLEDEKVLQAIKGINDVVSSTVKILNNTSPSQVHNNLFTPIQNMILDFVSFRQYAAWLASKPNNPKTLNNASAAGDASSSHRKTKSTSYSNNIGRLSISNEATTMRKNADFQSTTQPSSRNNRHSISAISTTRTQNGGKNMFKTMMKY
eukprot:Awhi_evm1s3936